MSRTNQLTKSWKKPLAMAVLLGGGGAVGYVVGRGLAQLDGLSARFDMLNAWDLLALPALFLVVIAVHEAGHLLAGLRQGMRFLLYVVGPFGWVRGGDGVRFRWFFNLGTIGGLAATLPKPERALAAQMKPVVLGGPLASLLLAALAFAVSVGTHGRLSAYALATGLISALIFAVTALPFRAGGFMSDGMQWLSYRRGGQDVERRARLTALMGMSLAGTRPRELDAALLQQAQATTGKEILCDMGVWLYSHAQALDQGDIEAAGVWGERMAAALDGYADGFRQAVAIELSIFESLYRRRADEARQWLLRAKGGVVDASRRDLAQAALDALEGRREPALRALDAAERRLHHGMDAGYARLGADQITALRRALSTSAPASSAA